MLSKVILRTIDKIVKILENMNVEYAIFGGMALQAWQRLRTTLDVDIMVIMDEITMKDLSDRMRKEGIRLESKTPIVKLGDITLFRFLYTDKETFIDIKIDIAIAMTEFFREVIGRAVSLKVFNRKMRFVTADDLILLKLLAGRPIDMVDAKEVLKINKDSLDMRYLKRQAKVLNIKKKFEKFLSKGGR
jgi:hypothetical protein